jgi:hypothetical protein
MSIYRRTDRIPLRGFEVDTVSRPPSAEQASEVDCAKPRLSEPANGLLKTTFAWAATLPVHVQPRALMCQFPRIANLIAAMWADANSLRRYVDDLLVDKRGNRQGFPVDVLRELFALRAHYDEIRPEKTRPWGP